jgi:hypothetical protein
MSPINNAIDLRVLEGLRCWNLEDPAFSGMVAFRPDDFIYYGSEAIKTIVAAIQKLNLAPISHINWTHRQIVFTSGAAIKIRPFAFKDDVLKYGGLVIWAVCFLNRVPDECYTFLKSRVEFKPANRSARKPDIRSRDEQAAAQKAKQEQLERAMLDVYRKTFDVKDYWSFVHGTPLMDQVRRNSAAAAQKRQEIQRQEIERQKMALELAQREKEAAAKLKANFDSYYKFRAYPTPEEKAKAEALTRWVKHFQNEMPGMTPVQEKQLRDALGKYQFNADGSMKLTPPPAAVPPAPSPRAINWPSLRFSPLALSRLG